ncbi:MAG TPA: ABC-2 transporter permease [Thermotogota bacterium]|nr:ABC-2 transporter permease [Thermotogota bacterium]HPJ89371.1 ABC-2 transporter permease [Thermotogota bacterium]HPR97109.1 ABC-2 transporter permease [Thermotogota bacterium]
MRELLYKEFKMAIHPAFYLIFLTALLLLIPNWVFTIAMSYLLWVVVPNLFAAIAANNDTFFSVLMPVKKSDVVTAKILTVVVLEILNVIIAIPFAVANSMLYRGGMGMLEPNPAFFGIVLIVYTLYNIVFIPGFYKTGYKMAAPILMAIIISLLFAMFIQVLPFISPQFNTLFNLRTQESLMWQIGMLIAGIVVFVLGNILTIKLSVKRFEKLDL